MRSLAGCKTCLKAAIKSGKQALQRAHANRIEVSTSHEILSAVDFDDSTREAYPERARWDYLLELKGVASARTTCAVEFHSIELSKVLKKQEDTQLILLILCDPKPKIDRWILVPEGSTTGASRITVQKLAQRGIEVSARTLRL